jgi:hypothetical protein
MGRRALFLLRAGLAVVGVGRDPRPATSPDDMRTQDVPTPSLDRDTRADTEHLSVRVVDVRLQPAVRVTEDQDVTGDHQPLASLGGAVALRSERRRVVARGTIGNRARHDKATSSTANSSAAG